MVTGDMMRPPIHRGMKVLDRSLFERQIPLAAVRIRPERIGALQAIAGPHLLRQPRIRRVFDDSAGGSAAKRKLVLLDSSITSRDLSALQPNILEFLEKEDAAVVPFTLTLDYAYWRADDIISAVIPEEFADEAPSSFTVTGHIAHMNLREQFFDYRKIIGQVILDKNPQISLVVNKLKTIDNSYRTFQMEVLAVRDQKEQPDFRVEQYESGCRFQFDFSKVYWNSRLHTEHERLVNKFQPGQVVIDVFAGVGPFALPAGKKGVFVLANDLNPDSFQSLQNNIRINKVSDFVKPYNLNGNIFIQRSLQELSLLQGRYAIIKKKQAIGKAASVKKKQGIDKAVSVQTYQVKKFPDHYVMNLPATALEFLSAFRGIYRDIAADGLRMPQIHVYAFTKSSEEDAVQELCEQASTYLGHTITPTEVVSHLVRNVAPNKVRPS